MRPVNAREFAEAGNLDQLHRLLGSTAMGPGWNKPEPSMWAAPARTFVPAHWSYALAKPALDAAGSFVSTELAERRNLILANPVPGNTYGTARTMVAAYQMVMPKERARTHRHTPNALRLVLDAGPGAYTVVEGKKIPMVPGDVLLTPNWCWHGHDNESERGAYWIDFLDAPLVHFLEPMFFEQFPGKAEEGSEIDERSPMRFPFSEVGRQLDAQEESQPGRRELRLGPPYLDTMALFVSRLDAGGNFSAGRTTAHAIFAVIDGHGRSVVENHEFEWQRGDVFVVPGWCRHEFRVFQRSHLLRVTDEPVMARMNWLRNE